MTACDNGISQSIYRKVENRSIPQALNSTMSTGSPSLKESIADFMRFDRIKPSTNGAFSPVQAPAEASICGMANIAAQLANVGTRRESFADPLKNDTVTLVSQKGPNCAPSQPSFAPTVLKKAICRKAVLIPMESNQAVAQGYEKRYKRNETTGRPNQVFVCTTCHAQRPKLSKMMKHLNVHKKDRKRGGARQKPQPRIADTVKLPSMGILLKNRMNTVQV
jgi:hypothetical protein